MNVAEVQGTKKDLQAWFDANPGVVPVEVVALPQTILIIYQ